MSGSLNWEGPFLRACFFLGLEDLQSAKKLPQLCNNLAASCKVLVQVAVTEANMYQHAADMVATDRACCLQVANYFNFNLAGTSTIVLHNCHQN